MVCLLTTAVFITANPITANLTQEKRQPVRLLNLNRFLISNMCANGVMCNVFFCFWCDSDNRQHVCLEHVNAILHAHKICDSKTVETLCV